ncbi:MAG: hypothetical protein ACRD72_19870 [Candidatus Angelobacter sp.]
MSAPTFLNAQPESLAATLLSGKNPDGTSWAGLLVQLSGSLPVGSVVEIGDGTTPTQKLAVDGAGEIGINNFPATQPISAASLPLPTGAAIEAGHLASIDIHLTPGTTSTVDQVTVASSSTAIGNQSATVRKYLLIKALSTNSASVFLKPGTATTAHGFELGAGEQHIIYTQEAWAGIVVTGSQVVCYEEVI